MPRYYCDYCDTYLTHDSPSVRKQHNAGYKHKANIRAYYQKFEEQQTQVLLEQKIKQHQAYHQIGAAYNQHLSAFPGVAPRLPILPPPPMPFPGAVPHQLPPGVRPPLMQMPPSGGAPGYSNAPPMTGQAPPSAHSLYSAPRGGPPPPGYVANAPPNAVNADDADGNDDAPASARNYPFQNNSDRSG